MVYIGQTMYPLNKRWIQHKNANSCCHVVRDHIMEYGEENFIIEAIDKADSIEDLNKKEMYWIGFYNCVHPKGLNIKYGGDNGRMTPYMLDKMRTVWADTAYRNKMAIRNGGKEFKVYKIEKDLENKPFVRKAELLNTYVSRGVCSQDLEIPVKNIDVSLKRKDLNRKGYCFIFTENINDIDPVIYINSVISEKLAKSKLYRHNRIKG